MDMGMKMMMKSLGFDPEKLQQEFTELVTGVKTMLKSIDDKLQSIEVKQDLLNAKVDSILTGVEEILSWQKKQVAPLLLNPQPQPPAQPVQPQPPLADRKAQPRKPQ